MRTMSWTIFLVVALHGLGSASPVSAASSSQPVPSFARTEAGAGSVLAEDRSAVLKTEAERASPPTEAKVLSRDLAKPKPVQIYWFFGGR